MATSNGRTTMDYPPIVRCTVAGVVSERGAVDMSATATTTATIIMSGMSKIRMPQRLALHCGASAAPT
jgi:hypothetical protein